LLCFFPLTLIIVFFFSLIQCWRWANRWYFLCFSFSLPTPLTCLGASASASTPDLFPSPSSTAHPAPTLAPTPGGVSGAAAGVAVAWLLQWTLS
jgi:hypothetical protein